MALGSSSRPNQDCHITMRTTLATTDIDRINAELNGTVDDAEPRATSNGHVGWNWDKTGPNGPVSDSARKLADETGPSPVAVNIATLIVDHPKLAEPVIDGLLRRGETGNIIADPKRGKSWLAYGLILSVATGDPWLGKFACPRGPHFAHRQRATPADDRSPDPQGCRSDGD